jgi:hypothetical protein
MTVTALHQRDYAAFMAADQAAPAAPPFEVLVDGQCDENWDDIAAGFDDVNYDQTATFSNLGWGEGRMSRIMLRHDGKVVALARVAIITLPGYRKGIAFTRGGPLWRRQGVTADHGIYRAAIAAIQAEYSVRRGHHLVITPRFNPDYAPLEADMLDAAGFRVLRKSADPNRYFVNLQLTKEQQMSSLDQGWRRNLKKAVANGFDIGLTSSDADLECFIALNRAMLKRKKFLDSGNVLLLPQLMRDMPVSLRPQIVLARYQGRPVVGAAITFIGDVAHYLFGASDDSMLPLKAGYALQWWTIEWLSGRGLKWYDLGGESLSDGLRQFKRGLVGKQGRVLEANVEREFDGSAGARMAAEAIFAVRSARRAYMKLLNR